MPFLGRKLIKKCRTALIMTEDKAMYERPSWCRYITRFLDNDQVENILAWGSNLSHKEKLNQAEKTRKQFGHASVNNMKELIRNTNLLDSEVSQLLKEVVDSCATFITFKKASARPIVSLSKADDFN